MRPASGGSHAHRRAEILERLGGRSDIRLWDAATGYALSFGDEQRVLHFGVNGQADLTGILPNGRRLEVEVKTPRDKLRPDQLNFREMILSRGGLYIVARTADEAEQELAKHGYPRPAPR